MGGALSAKVVFVGLDGSGKTSILNYLTSGSDQPDPKPTKTFNNVDVKFKGNREMWFSSCFPMEDFFFVHNGGLPPLCLLSVLQKKKVVFIWNSSLPFHKASTNDKGVAVYSKFF